MSKILRPSEYQAQNPDAYLNDYISYLEELVNDTYEVLENAKALHLDDDIQKQIKNQAIELTKILNMITYHMHQLVLNSIDKLPKDELKLYFNYEQKRKDRQEERESLKSKKSESEEELKQIEKQMEKNLYENGRSKEFYEAEDVNVFFTPTKTLEEFFSQLLSADLPKTLQNNLNIVLATECKIQKINVSVPDIERLSHKFIELLQSYQRIIEYASEAKEQIIKNLISSPNLKELLTPPFAKDTYTYITHSLMNLTKKNTVFYQSLPISLQEKLTLERLQGKTYQTLLKTYQEWSRGEMPKNNDLNQTEHARQNNIQNRLMEIEEKLIELDNEEKKEQEFLDNEQAMRTKLKEYYPQPCYSKSIKEIDEAIAETSEKIQKQTERLNNAYQLLTTKTSHLKMAQNILINPGYHKFFQAVEQENTKRLYYAMGLQQAEEIIEAFLTEEQRRHQQITIMISIENELDKIYKNIFEKKKSASFITKRLTSYKDSLKQLQKQYQETVERGFTQLKENNLLHINTPQVETSNTNQLVITNYTHCQRNPQSFDELLRLPQVIPNILANIDKNIQEQILKENPNFSSWTEYINYLLKEISQLANKLFDFLKYEDGYYLFSTTEKEREVLSIQHKKLVSILEMDYKKKKDIRIELENQNITLDKDKVAILETILGQGNNLSRENLANYIEKTKKELESLKQTLSEYPTFCKKIGIELPSEPNKNKMPSEEKQDPEENIKKLNIEDIKTLEQAIAYRNLLSELQQYLVNPQKIKKDYVK